MFIEVTNRKDGAKFLLNLDKISMINPSNNTDQATLWGEEESSFIVAETYRELRDQILYMQEIGEPRCSSPQSPLWVEKAG